MRMTIFLSEHVPIVYYHETAFVPTWPPISYGKTDLRHMSSRRVFVRAPAFA
jgi:hypothetical protein